MPMHRYWAEPDLAARLTATVNEAIAAHCADGAGRLHGIGTLPLQHPALAVRELERAVRDLGLSGASVSTSVAGRELADPAFDPVWEAAADLGAVIFIHPWGCSLGARLSAHYLGNTFGQPAETALALSHLIFGGTLDRHPGLRLLAAHGGGFLPTYIGRSDHAWHSREDARGCARPPSEYLRQVWYDALVYPPGHCATSSRRSAPSGWPSAPTTPSTWASPTRSRASRRPASRSPTRPRSSPPPPPLSTLTP